ncbi:MAG: hypothetical protein JXR25_06430 [Pontiellaceae bacterium]|nr:hypothetical protein [Pontiellaceae bacterium]MBN2784445.1 hypothetical protein [Pontiellaceae bacterium]
MANINKHILTISIALGSILIASPNGQADMLFHKIDGLPGARIQRIELSAARADFIAVASENTLYVNTPDSNGFQKALVLKDEQISDLFITHAEHPAIYLAGTRNAYFIEGAANRIYSARSDELIQCIAEHTGRLFIGTSDGLYSSDSKILNWQPVSGLRNDSIHSILSAGMDLYIAADSGVYSYRPETGPKRIFVTRSTGTDDGLIPQRMIVDAMTPSRLWLATNRGIYRSDNRGETWEHFSAGSTDQSDTYCIAQFALDENHLYVVNESGLYKMNVSDKQSTSLYAGLSSSNINWVEINDTGALYVACDQGLFTQQKVADRQQASDIAMPELMQGEPTIHEVQESAMRYNSVHPDKTEAWRKRLKYRALLPKLSVDYDKTIGSSFTSSGYYYAEGPNDWGISLTWDMGELIWNSYEDDIDNRTKLTTQLRMDILDEINRLYFERLRLKHEIAVARTDGEDVTLRELRLYELTATIDGYTGGLYSCVQ